MQLLPDLIGNNSSIAIDKWNTIRDFRRVKVLPAGIAGRELRGNPVTFRGMPELTRNCERRAALPSMSLAF